eukprot:g3035.t1
MTSHLAAIFSEIDHNMTGMLATLNAPSVALIVVHNGKVLHESYVGSARVNQSGTKAPVSRDSGYRIASNTKVFTSLMLFQLRDRGLLPQGLDTEVRAIMPGFVDPAPAEAGPNGGPASRRGITLKALAMQASGLQRENPLPGERNETKILEAIAESALLHPPFAATHYSNLGLALLGRALEKVSRAHGLGDTWEDYVARHILAPLGMKSTGSFYTDEVRSFLVDGVDPATGRREPVPCPSCSSWDAPCGQLYSTPRDMANWAAFLNGQSSPWGDFTMDGAARAVLDPGSRLEMHQTAVLQADGISAVGGATFELAHSARRWTANKLGCEGGYRSDTTIVPSLGLGVFAAAASTCDYYGDGDAVAFPAVAALIPALEAALTAAEVASPKAPGGFLDPAVVNPAAVDELLGTYQCGEGGGTMTLEMGVAGLQISGQDSNPVQELDWGGGKRFTALDGLFVNGDLLYVTELISSSFLVRNLTSGEFRELDASAAGISWPDDFTLTPDGDRIIAASFRTGKVISLGSGEEGFVIIITIIITTL